LALLACCVATTVFAGDLDALVTQLHHASEGIRDNPLTQEELLELGVWENERVLAEVGLAQLDIGDLAGAAATARLLPNEDNCRNCAGFCRTFLIELASAYAKANQVQAAFEVLSEHRSARRNGPLVEEYLAISKAQAEAGNSADARQTCEKAANCVLDDAPNSAYDLMRIAQAQIALGNRAAAHLLVPRIEILKNKTESTGQDRSLLAARLAVVLSRLGDDAGAAGLLREAKAAVDESTFAKENCWNHISRAFARTGDFPNALRAAAKSADGSAYATIALIQAARGNLDDAERTALLGREPCDLVIIEIARIRSRNGDEAKGIAVLRQLDNDERRVQGLLQVATEMVKLQKIEAALELLRSLPALKTRDFISDVAVAFAFDSPKSWGAPFAASRAFTMAGRIHGKETDNDLLRSAICAQIALNGRGTIPPFQEVRDWDARTTCSAQASLGDLSGALAWSSEMTRPQRIAALIGTAAGHAELTRTRRMQSAKGPVLSRDHPLLRRYWCYAEDP